MCSKLKLLILIFISVMLSACATSQKSNAELANQTKVAEINIQLGMKYLEMKNYQRAKQKLFLAMEENPKLPEVHYALAYFYQTSGDMQLANQYYLEALALAPKRGDVLNNYGTFLCRTGDYRGAIARFQLAAEDKEYLDTAGAYENAGWCALKIPNKQLAANYFKLAVMHDPRRTLALQEWKKIAASNTDNQPDNPAPKE